MFVDHERCLFWISVRISVPEFELTNNLDVISNQFMKLTTDRDRISYLLQLDVVHNHLRLPDNNCQSLVSAGGKSSDLATKFRTEKGTSTSVLSFSH